MPDKVQKITIEYDFNTGKIIQATANLRNAQIVAEKFESTTVKAGRAAEQSYSSATRSIVVMKQELERLKFRIENTSGADKKRLADLSAQYKKLDGDIRKTTDSLYKQEQAIKATQTATQKSATSFGELYQAAKLFVSAGIVSEVVNVALEAAKLAGNVDGVERAFARAIPNSVILLNDLRESTQGTIDDFTLMKQALQAKNFGLPIENLSKLLEFAAVKAQQTGLSIDYITNSLVTGLGRKSERVFDNLQLDIAELRKRIASGLDFREAGIQLVIEDLERMGGKLTTSATLVDQLTTEVQELRIEAAKKLTEGGGGGFIGILRDGVSSLSTAVKGFPIEAWIKVMNPLSGFTPKDVLNFFAAWQSGITNVVREEKNLELAIGAVKQVQDGLTGTNDERIDSIQKEIDSRSKLLIQYNYAVANLKDEQDLLKAKNPYDSHIESLNKQIVAYLRSGEVVNKTIELLHKEQLALKAMAGDDEGLGLIEAKLKEIEEKSDAIKTGKSREEIHKLSNELAILNGELADLKAFGTTKQFLSVGGEIKLVPVVAQGSLKKLETDLKAEPLFKEGVVIPVTIGGEFVENKGIDTRAATDQFQAAIDEMIRVMPDSISNVIPIPVKPVFKNSAWDDIADEFAANWKDITSQGIGATTDIITAAVQSEADAYDQRLNDARAYYDRLMTLAGDNENAKDRLRLREAREEKRLRQAAFEADKRAKSASAVINGAAGVINAFATLPYPAAIVAAVLIAAETAAQLAVISQQKPRFAKGVIGLKGPGTGTSDSIDAKVSRGESIMTSDETDSSGGLLRDIRAGKLNDKIYARNLNDKVLADFKLTKEGVRYVGMSDKRIVKEIQELKNSQPDYKELNGMLYRTRKKGEAYKQWVRTRAMG